MFIFILAASITVAWSLVFHKAMRDERRRYQRLYKQTLEISEHNDELLQQLRKEKRGKRYSALRPSSKNRQRID